MTDLVAPVTDHDPTPERLQARGGVTTNEEVTS